MRLAGVIVSAKMQKTAVVEVLRLKKHPRYGKYIRVTKRYKAHADGNQYEEGDRVLIESTRPLSKEKRWIIVGKA